MVYFLKLAGLIAATVVLTPVEAALLWLHRRSADRLTGWLDERWREHERRADPDRSW